MILTSLKVKNFRQYKDEVRIDFTKDPEKNFTILQGTNGAGKTTLLNAITWCLYGEELHNVTDDPIYNEIVENETERGGNFKVKVEVEALNKENDVISFKRELQFFKEQNGKIFDSIYDGNEFSIYKNNDPVSHPTLYVDSNMPKDIEEYFFFDGEKLEDYFRENTGTVIKKSVFKITQLKLLQRLINHLDERRRYFGKKVRDISPNTGAIEQQIILKEDSIATNDDLLKKAIKQRKIAEKKIKKYTNELKRVDSTDIKNLQIERERLKFEVQEADNDIDELEKEKADFLLEMAPIILAFPTLKKTLQKADKLVEKGFIPAQYKKKFLEDLIDEGKCICGTDLSENEECKKHLEDLWEKTSVLTNIGDEIGTEQASIENLLSKLNNFREKQKRIGKNLRRLKKERDDKSKRIKEISLLIKDSEIEKVNYFEEMLEENERLEKSKIREELNLESEIKSAKRIVEKLKAERDKEMQKNAELEKMKDILHFCEKSLSASKTLKDELIEDIRIRIEQTTKDQFLKLNWKESFTDVKIDDDYDVTVIRMSGRISDANGLSAGEKLALALSFMAALNEISGFDLPIIIDTPMGRLDKEIKLNIAKVLPKYLENKQITLLVTGEEYSPEFRHKLSDRVGKEYTIEVTQTKYGNKSEVVLHES
nr:AAA family ATPase [uncultured Methanobacterium sp.]